MSAEMSAEMSAAPRTEVSTEVSAAPSAAMNRGVLTLVALLGFWLATCGLSGIRTAAAHQTSMKQLEVRVAERSLALTLRVATDDLASAVGRDSTTATRAELLVDRGVAPTVTSWVRVSAAGEPCALPPAQPGGQAVRIADDADPRFVAVSWRLACPRQITALALDFSTFFLLDAAHTMVVRVEGHGEPLDTVVGIEDSPLELRLAEPPRSFPRWLHLGLSHIFGGIDHICFVITLLFAAILSREGASWQLRSWRSALRRTAVLITSFSVAHSLTLIAASLGWISLPSRFVETIIALSIGYAAVENSLRPDAPWRWLLTFAFGLVHGLGFASALRELLPPDRVTLPLLAFNLGVEIGQLVIVAAALPLLLALAHLLRAHRYRFRFLPISSILLGSLALLWSMERAFDLALW